MTINAEQLAAANKAAIDSLLAVANTALASAERIAELNLNTVRGALEDSASGAQALLGAKNVQEAVSIQNALVQPSVEKAVAYSRSLYEISTETQQALANTVEAQFSDFHQSVAGLVEHVAKAAPAGSEGVVAAFQNAIATANSTFNALNVAAKQFAEATQASMAAAAKMKSK